jgi:plastin-1
MHGLGYRTMKESDVETMIAEIDLNDNKEIEFIEFVKMMKNFVKDRKETTLKNQTNKKGQNIFRVGESSSSSFSSFSEEERAAFVRVINTVLTDDEVCQKYLPIAPDTMDIFTILKNGVILCKLINKACAGTIDDRVISVKENMNIFLMAENLKHALKASKSIGCQVINIFPETILEEKYVLVLGLLWQIIKKIVLKEVNLNNHPQLIRLLKDGEQIGDLLKLNPEDLLLRWFNYHLENAGYDKKVKNFGPDIKDSEKYTILLNQLNKDLCDKSALQESDHKVRANKVLENSKKLGVECFITPNDITDGNVKLNTLFTAAIFNQYHGLDPPTEEEKYEAAKILNDDVEGSRQERAFRMWINSFGLPNIYLNNLYEECRSGVLLLKVIEKIKPGYINWKRVDETSTNKFKRVVNCGEAVEACKKAGFSIIGIGGTDIHEGNKKYILAIVWQLMRAHTLQVVGSKSEDDLLKWANSMVPKEHQISSFKDKKLKNSIFFINLMSAIEPRAINWEIVVQGIKIYNHFFIDSETDEAIENNAKYAISVSRKLGASIFLVWEDIKELKVKMLLTFVGSLYEVSCHEQILKKNKMKVLESEGKTAADLD